VRAHYAVIDEQISRAVDQAHLALKSLPFDDYFTRGTAGVALGAAYWGAGDVFAAESAFKECANNARKGGFDYRASSALVYQGMQQVKQARLRSAEKTFQEALALSEGPGGKRYPNAGYPLAKLAELYCEWNQLEQACSYADSGVELCRQLGHVDLMAEAHIAAARVRIALRDIDALESSILAAERILEGSKLDPWIKTWLDECRIRMWVMTGNLEQAVHWSHSSGLSINDDFNFHHDLDHLNLARVLVFQALHEPTSEGVSETLSLLERLQGAATKAGWAHHIIQILVLKAITLYSSGKKEQGLAEINSAIELAEPGGYVRTFIDYGSILRRLLNALAQKGISTEYLKSLITYFDGTITASMDDLLVEPLTSRELDVLRLLGTSLSTPEIAQELYISVNTVRSHVKNIYGKLNVNRRMAAVNRAAELGLLSRKGD